MKQIYFSGSITSGREDVEIYSEIIQHLKKYGLVLTEHIADKNLTSMGENLSNKKIHDRDMDWLGKATHVVAEVTRASSGVGYEIGRIVERNLWVAKKDKKPILCLYRLQPGKRVSAMIAGSDSLIVVEYKTLQEAKIAIDRFFKEF